MKLIIRLIVVVLTFAALIDFALLFRNLKLGSTSNTIICLVVAGVIGFGIYYLFQLDKKRIEKEDVELKKKVEYKIWHKLQKSEAYELNASLTFYSVLIVTFVFMGILPLFISYDWLITKDNGLSIVPLILIFFGLLFVFQPPYLFFHIVGKPIIRIDEFGIHHYSIGLINWNDITAIYLYLWVAGSAKNYSLEVCVQNPQSYRSKFKGLLRNSYKAGKFLLHLPVSEENAKIAESVAKTYAVRANAPILETNLANIKSFTEFQDIFQKEITHKNIGSLLEHGEKLATLSEDVLTSLQNKREKLSKSLKVAKYIYISGIVALLVEIYFAFKK
jgi:hypothetical protein